MQKALMRNFADRWKTR